MTNTNRPPLTNAQFVRFSDLRLQGWPVHRAIAAARGLIGSSESKRAVRAPFTDYSKR